MDVCLINNNLPHFSFMSFIATLQLVLLDRHNSTRKCWSKLKTLHTIQALVWHLTMKCQRNQKFTVTIGSSIQLCISCYAGNDDKGNANISYDLSCTWQTPNHTTAGRTSLLCEVWETVLHGWKLVRLVLMCTVYKNAFQKWFQACKSFLIPPKVPRYFGLHSIKYQLDECKIWGNDSRQRNVDYL